MRTPAAAAYLRTGVACGLLAAAACGRDVGPPAPDPGRETISREAYAAALADLAVGRVEALPDTAAWRARRAAILAAHRISPDDLVAFAEIHGGNDALMAEVYAVVGARLDSLARTMPDPSAGIPTEVEVIDAARAAAAAATAGDPDAAPDVAPPPDIGPGVAPDVAPDSAP